MLNISSQFSNCIQSDVTAQHLGLMLGKTLTYATKPIKTVLELV